MLKSKSEMIYERITKMAFYLGSKANNNSADVRKKKIVRRRDRKKTDGFK